LLARLAAEAGYEAEVTRDPAAFEPARIESFDVIAILASEGSLAPEHEEALLNAVIGSPWGDTGAPKGLLGIHGATVVTSASGAYQRMLGAASWPIRRSAVLGKGRGRRPSGHRRRSRLLDLGRAVPHGGARAVRRAAQRRIRRVSPTASPGSTHMASAGSATARSATAQSSSSTKACSGSSATRSSGSVRAEVDARDARSGAI